MTDEQYLNLTTAQDWDDAELDRISDSDLWAYFDEGSVGNAKLYNRLNRGRVVFVAGWGQPLIWHGQHWVNDDYNIAYQRTEAVVKAYARLLDAQKVILADKGASQEAKDAAQARSQKLLRRIDGIRSKNGQESLILQAQRVYDPLMIQPSDLDTDHYKLGVSNGVVNLKTGMLMQGVPEDYILNAAPTAFRPELMAAEDPCPETSSFLFSSMNGDKTLVDFIWRLLGYGLIRERKDHIFPIFWGPHGRNGKDTLIKLVTHVLGKDLSGNVPVEMFLQTQQVRNSSAPSPDIMALKGMCIGWINEAEDGQRFAMSKLKALTGGGLITARGLQDKQMTTFAQTHLCLMTTNELPRAKADDDAFWERILILEWELSFVEKPDRENKPYQREADKYLDEKLDAEREGVLARMVMGAMEYIRDGLKIPDKVRKWTLEQRNSMDDLAAFLDECCLVETAKDMADSVMEISAKDLLRGWTLWYAENRDRKHVPQGKALGIMLDKREIPKKKRHGGLVVRIGLELNQEWETRVRQSFEDEENRGKR